MTDMQAKAFAAACSALLVRFFSEGIPSEAIDGSVLRDLVGSLWDSVTLDSDYPGDPSRDAEMLDSVLSGDYYEELGVGEHVISGVYYAIAAIRDGDHGTGELVARNLYEAVDYNLVARPGFDIASQSAEREVLESPPMQQALTFISASLSMAGSIADDATRASIRNYAESFMLSPSG